MRKQDVIAHFGSQRAVAKALRISDAAVSQWCKIIPEKDAYRLESITNGQLKYQEYMYRETLKNNILFKSFPQKKGQHHQFPSTTSTAKAK